MSGCYCDGEPADVVRHEVRRARKPHRCYECCAAIAPGERYEYTGMVYEGTADSFSTCLRCVDLREALAKVCQCWSFGAVRDCAREHMREERPVSEIQSREMGWPVREETPTQEWADFGRLAGVWMRQALEVRP